MQILSAAPYSSSPQSASGSAQVHPRGVLPQALAINLSCLALEFPCCTLGSPLEHSLTPNWEQLMPSGATLDQRGTDVNG